MNIKYSCLYFVLYELFIQITYVAAANCDCCCKAKWNTIIPEEYDKHTPPRLEGDKPVIVYVSLDIMDIDEIAEDKMEYSMQFYVNEYWKDPRLNLSRFKVGGKLPRSVFDELWTPDTLFEDSKGGWIYQLSVPNLMIQMHHFGYLHRFTRYNMKVSCRMSLHSYPMDTQICYLNLSSLANDNSMLILKWLHEREEGNSEIQDMAVDSIHPLKYYIKSSSSITRELKWPMGTYSGVGAKFVFSRHLTSHIFNVYIPSGLIVVLSFLSFWLNVRSVPARVALGLTSLLTLSTQASQARSHLPPINYMTALDIWLFSCMLQVFLSLLEYAFVYHLYSVKIRNKKLEKATAWMDTIKTGSVSPSLSVSKSSIKQKKLKVDATATNEPLGPDFEEDTQLLDKISRLVFPMGFLIFSLIYWIGYLRK